MFQNQEKSTVIHFFVRFLILVYRMREAGFAPKAQQLFSTSLLLEQTSRSFSVYLNSHSQSVLALNIKFSEIPSRT